MLTVDLVRARRRGGDLVITEIKGRAKSRAKRFAETYLSLAEDHLGETRGAFEEACATVAVGPRERKLALGMKKLVEDLCTFESDDTLDARALRRQVFQLASQRRRELAEGELFDRSVVLEEVARERGRGETPEELLSGLYSDLREAQLLRETPSITASALVERYQTAQAQAVLLRATRVSAEVRCQSPTTYRFLFGKLKFRRLLYKIRKLGDGYRIEIDGPYSLFSSVTKYGLQLALVLPALQQCDQWTIEAEVLWGKERRPLRFHLSGGAGGRAVKEADPAEDLPEEVQTFVEQFRKLDSGWVVAPSTEILDLPGHGLSVPDLRFDHPLTATTVHLEVMGFWSRAAVWKRVELIEAGLPHRIIFAVPKRLRVSEEVLDEELPGELYVYKGKMRAKAILERLDAIIASLELDASQ